MGDICSLVGDTVSGLFDSGAGSAATDLGAGSTSGALDAFANGSGGLGSDAAGVALSPTDMGSASTIGALDAFANGAGGLGSSTAADLVPGSSTQALNDMNQPLAGSNPTVPSGGSAGSGPSLLSRLNPLSALSGSGGKGISGTALALGALAALGSMGHKQTPLPGPASTRATRGPIFSTPLNTTSSINRQPVSFANTPASDWYTYGQRPEPLYFTGNNLNFGSVSPTGTTQGMAAGGPIDPHPDIAQDAGYHGYIPGSDPGQADTQDAKLSHGEYVLDAQTLSSLGDGNNAAGAKKMDTFRNAIAQHKGLKKLIPPKAKSPLEYLKGAA